MNIVFDDDMSDDEKIESLAARLALFRKTYDSHLTNSHVAMTNDISQLKAHCARLEKTLIKVMNNQEKLYDLLEKVLTVIPEDKEVVVDEVKSEDA